MSNVQCGGREHGLAGQEVSSTAHDGGGDRAPDGVAHLRSIQWKKLVVAVDKAGDKAACVGPERTISVGDERLPRILASRGETGVLTQALKSKIALQNCLVKQFIIRCSVPCNGKKVIEDAKISAKN